jgi:hypothetical protein
VELKLNVAHQLLVYADDVNLLGHNLNTMKKNKEAVIDTSKEVGLQVNTDVGAPNSEASATQSALTTAAPMPIG